MSTENTPQDQEAIDQAAQEIGKLCRRNNVFRWEIGGVLERMKAEVEHGRFEEAVETIAAQCGYTKAGLLDLHKVRVSKSWPGQDLPNAAIRHIQWKVMRKLSAKSMKKEIIADCIAEADKGQLVSMADFKAIEARHTPQGDTKDGKVAERSIQPSSPPEGVTETLGESQREASPPASDEEGSTKGHQPASDAPKDAGGDFDSKVNEPESEGHAELTAEVIAEALKADKKLLNKVCKLLGVEVSAKKAKKKPAFEPREAELPFAGDPEFSTFRDAWMEWCDHRDELGNGKKLTPTSVKRQFRKCEEWGIGQSIAIIYNAIEKGWQGLYEPTDQAGNRIEKLPTPGLKVYSNPDEIEHGDYLLADDVIEHFFAPVVQLRDREIVFQGPMPQRICVQRSGGILDINSGKYLHHIDESGLLRWEEWDRPCAETTIENCRYYYKANRGLFEHELERKGLNLSELEPSH